LLFFAFAIESRAQEILSAHTGTTDPATENFTTLNTGSGTVGPVNDQGYPAWEITSLSSSSNDQVQYIDYRLLSTNQQNEITNTGFTETLVARVDLNVAPAWTSSSPTILASTSVGVYSVAYPRFDIDLSINSSGNTVVTLPTTYYFGPGDVVQATGPTVTLTDSAYHTYQLYYNPRAYASQ
jgi:hypothetical protein